MGDITDMMEEGILCAQCGCLLEDSLGIPFQLCDICQEDDE
jgi:hypothetical protein